MPELTFRHASPDDADAIVRLVNSAYRGDTSRQGWTTEADLLDGQRTDAATLRAEITSPETTMLLAELGQFADDMTLVGCCLLRREADSAYLGMVTVDPARQGTGLGRALIGEAERRAAQTWDVRRVRMTVITARRELIAFYERLGYRDTGAREPFPYGDDRFGVPRREGLEFAELVKAL